MRTISDHLLSLAEFLFRNATQFLAAGPVTAGAFVDSLKRIARALDQVGEAVAAGNAPRTACQMVDQELRRLVASIDDARVLPAGEAMQLKLRLKPLGDRDETRFVRLGADAGRIVEDISSRSRTLAVVADAPVAGASPDPQAVAAELAKLDRAARYFLEIVQFLESGAHKRSA